MIKAVLFDIDGVLLDSFAANLKFYQNLMTAFGYRPPTEEEYRRLFYFNMRDAIIKMAGLEDEGEINKIWEAGKSRESSYPFDLLEVPDQSESVIAALSREYLLGIVTSRIKNSVYEVPQLAKLKSYFKTTIAYEDTANHKPDPEPLLAAARALGVKPEEAVYIGDADNDMKAAKAAGMKAILYSEDEAAEAEASAEMADARVNSFGALPAAIKKL